MAEPTPGVAAGALTHPPAHPVTGPDADPSAVYALGHSGGESARLQRQADGLAPASGALLDRVGVGAGDRALDLGCGLRGIFEMLSDRVTQSGWVAGLEADTGTAICYPPHPAFDRLREIFTVAFARNGASPHLGRRMAEMYRQAGLVQVGVEARAAVSPAGHSRRAIRADLVPAMRPQILELGLADAAALDELDAAARRHFADPDTVVMPTLMFLAWGRKSAAR